MTVPLPRPFDRQYMQLALAAGVVVGACAPLVGTFLVSKRLALMGDGVGHMAFAGVAAGLLAGVEPLWAALGLAVAGAMGIEWLRLRGRASGDLALAVFFYTGIAAAVVLTGLAGSLNAGVLGYLFGSVLTVSPTDTVTVAAFGAAILAAGAVAGRAMFAVILDEEAARVAGLPVDWLSLGLAALTAVTVVAAMRVVGVLLAAALMVLPVGAAQRIARSFSATVRLSMAIGVGSVVVGLAAARLGGLASGGTIVLVAAGVFAVAATANLGRGVRVTLGRRPRRGIPGSGPRSPRGGR